MVSSTGVIGVPLPVDKLLAAMPAAVGALSAAGVRRREAIMTTDTVAKEAAVSVTWTAARTRLAAWPRAAA